MFPQKETFLGAKTLGKFPSQEPFAEFSKFLTVFTGGILI